MKIFELLEDRSDISQSPEFKRWFGDSKVVDDSGKPLVVYRGVDKDYGPMMRVSKEGALGAGIYMTPNPEFASNYASGEYGNVMPLYVSLQNPLILKMQRREDPMILALVQLGMNKDKAADVVEKAYEKYGYIRKQVMTRAISQNYDGIMQYHDNKLSEVVAFYPYQVKSAIGNTGNYTPYGGDITKEELNESVNVPGSNNTLPPEPGSTPIPNGTVRLYHQTDEKNLESIASNGLNIQYARGIEGPRAIYASKTGFYGKPEKTPTVEFYIDIDKWDDPFVLQDVPTEQIIAVHYPWHKQARYILDHQDTLKNTLNGEFDDLGGDYAKAVDYVKTVYKNTKL